MNTQFQIFTDFDGTISLNDVGDKVFENFSDSTWRDILQQWYDGKIGSKEYYIKCSKIIKMTKHQLKKFCESQKIDESFKNFVTYCTLKNYPLTVLSDGMDNYIKGILSNNDIANLTIYANRFEFIDDNRVEVKFPYFEKGCLKCANCKGAHIKEHRKNGAKVVFIGDGLSDICGIHESDIIFAKDDLKLYCETNSIPFFNFNNFRDILQQIKKIENE